jgi:serine/threonine protein kinase
MSNEVGHSPDESSQTTKQGSETLVGADGNEYVVDYSELLGAGQFGRVFGGTGPTGDQVAVKIVDLRVNNGTSAWVRDAGAAEREEVVNTHLAAHRDTATLDGIVPLITSVRETSRLVLVLPRAQTSLADVIAARRKAAKDTDENDLGQRHEFAGAATQHLPASAVSAPDDREIRHIAVELTRALVRLHEAGVMHRDIKPNNALLWNGTWCWADFGIARVLEQQTGTIGTFAWMGTREYLAPEVVAGRSQTLRSDVYSLGCTLYELATGQVPFQSERPTAHLTELPDLRLVHDRVLARALTHALSKTHDSRVTAEQLLDMLEGPAASSTDLDGLRELAARGRRREDEQSVLAERAAARAEASAAALDQLRRIWDELTHQVRSVDPSGWGRHADTNRSEVGLYDHRMFSLHTPPSDSKCAATAVGTLSLQRVNQSSSTPIANLYAQPDTADDGVSRWRIVQLRPNFTRQHPDTPPTVSLDDLERWLNTRMANEPGPPEFVEISNKGLTWQILVDHFVAESSRHQEP